MEKQNKMKCKEIHNLIQPFLNGMLDVKENEDFLLHMEECKSCKRILEEVKATMSILDMREKLTPDPFLYTRLAQEIENRKTPEPLRIFQRILQPIAAVAILFVGIYLGIGLGNSYVSKGEEIASADDQTIVDDFLFNDMEYETIEFYLLNE